MRRPSLSAPLRPRHAVAALAVVAALAGLAACKGDETAEAASASPGAAALRASAPAMSTANVPPPPRLAAASAAASQGATSELATVRTQLESTLTQASACSADTECRTVATGAKACGGPTAYRAYSTAKADPKAVGDLAQREHELGMAEARASGQVSPCFMLADPGAHCQQHKCVTGPADAH